MMRAAAAATAARIRLQVATQICAAMVGRQLCGTGGSEEQVELAVVRMVRASFEIADELVRQGLPTGSAPADEDLR